MNEQQVTFRPLHYKSKDNTVPIFSFGDEIVENIVGDPVSSESEYWESIFAVVKTQLRKNNRFFARPQWKEIHAWMAENSFMFNLNKKLLEDMFVSLIKSSDALYNAFKRKVCPPNVHKLCSSYLSEYYYLINRLQEQDVLDDDLAYRSQLLHMLKTGYKCNEKNGKFDINNKLFFRFFSPIFLEELRVFYSFIENDIWYQNRLCDRNKELIKSIYKHIILEKFRHLFFFEVTQLKDRYISTYYNIDVQKLINRDNLSSIEPIRPVRWIDKIKAYVDNLKRSGKDTRNGKPIKVAAIGYVNLEGTKENCYSSELGMFYETLSQIRIEDFDSAYDFEIDIFPNSNDIYFKEFIDGNCIYSKSKNGISVNIKFVNYLDFFSPRNNVNTNICKVISEHNIVLLEDVPNIYTHEYKLLKKSGKDFPNNGKNSDYESEYKRMDFKNEDFLVVNYRYAPINLLSSKLNLISMNEDIYGDTLEYKINQPLIDYLRDYMKSLKYDDWERNVYIFTSKKSGVNFSEYAQFNFTREERYNAKSFYLITLSNRESKTLRTYPYNDKKNFMVISLWNMLKNIDYSFVESEAFLKDILYCEKEEVCALAMKIYVKMSWDFPNKKFLFEICFDPKLKQRKSEPDRHRLKSLLDNLFEIIFSSEKNLFTKCVRRSFLNAVYSQMEYIEDAIFYCVLYNGFSENNEPSVEIRFSNFEERYVYSVNQPIFWNLTNILKLLNKNVFHGDRIWEIDKIYELNRNIYKSAGLDTLNVLWQCIKKICEKYGYTNSDIYCNLVSLLT